MQGIESDILVRLILTVVMELFNLTGFVCGTVMFSNRRGHEGGGSSGGGGSSRSF